MRLFHTRDGSVDDTTSRQRMEAVGAKRVLRTLAGRQFLRGTARELFALTAGVGLKRIQPRGATPSEAAHWPAKPLWPWQFADGIGSST